MKDPSRAGDAGFTLIEALIATALLLSILAMLASVTAQWLPSWNRASLRAQRSEHLAFGVERIVADLSAAEFIPLGVENKRPMFEGAELSVTFVRTAIGPNTQRGLEVVRLGEVADAKGLVLVRATAAFVPQTPQEGPISQLRFSDPVVLIRPPYRTVFSYAGSNREWLPTWRDAETLPGAVRIVIRDGTTGQILPVSTIAKVHIDTPAECASNKVSGCFDKPANATAVSDNATQQR